MTRRLPRPAVPQGTPLPPAEPPAAEVVELLDRLRIFREHQADAERQVHMLERALHEADGGLPPGSRTYYRIEIQVARNRVTLWTREVRALERAARSMGLKP